MEARVVDPTHLELARPIGVARGRTVVVSVVEPGEPDRERDQWQAVSASSLEHAYGPGEPEYTPTMVREANPDYAG